MIYHVKDCLVDTSLNNITPHHGTNDLRSKENQVFISALVVRNYQLVKKDNEVNKLLWANVEQEKCYYR